MKRIFWLIAVTILFSCGLTKERYKTGTVRLTLSFAAKEMCSCHFVMGLHQEYCKEYVKVKQLPMWLSYDDNTKTTRARFLWIREDAFFDGENSGCRLR